MGSFRTRRQVAVATVFLYLLVNALLILCLVHPEEGDAHSQHQHPGHLDVVCLWVQKAVSFHAPSLPPALAVTQATLFLLLAPVTTLTRARVIRLTGRSPPHA
jgi:hypothetical protein